MQVGPKMASLSGYRGLFRARLSGYRGLKEPIKEFGRRDSQ
jgi:hypothetical protein